MSDRRRSVWFVSLVLALGFVVNYIDRGNVSVAGPALQKEFHVSPTQLGLLFSSFFLAYGVMQIPAGLLVDRLNLKWLYTAAFVFWSLASAAVGLARSFQQVLLLRLLLSVGESISLPASSKILARDFTENERGVANGLIDSGYKFGPAIGTLFGGLFLARYGWRSLFVVTGLVGLLWLIPWLLIAGPGGPPEARELPSLTIKDILTSVRAWGTFAGNFCGGYVWALMLSWIPSYLVMERHMSTATMGVYGSFLFIATGVTSVATGWVTDRLIRSGASASKVRIGFASTGLLLTTLIVPGGFLANPVYGFLFLLAACAFFGFYSSNVWAISQSIAGPRNIGRWSGLQNLCGNLGSVASPAATGWIVTATGSFQLAFLVTAGILVIGALIYVFVIRTLDGIEKNSTASISQRVPASL